MNPTLPTGFAHARLRVQSIPVLSKPNSGSIGAGALNDHMNPINEASASVGDPHVAERNASPSRRYLFGVQGLRTVAALMVAVYHIWFQRVSGGVDVFFVVAGFFAFWSLSKLLTSSDIRQRSIILIRYLLRTARRVLPSATVVIASTVVASILWMPKTQWAPNIEGAWASLRFTENYNLIAQAADYQQWGNDVSVFQQFWALAIQVQSYSVFAVFAFFVTASAAVLRINQRFALLAATAAAFLLSFAYSVLATASNQEAAYFSFPARFWEFLFGVLLAAVLTKYRVPRVAAWLSGWIGLAIIVSFAAFVDLSHLLPGYMSLVPALGAAGVIVASRASSEPRILVWKPVLWFADSSFAFYLWHWPLLIFYRWYISPVVGIRGGMAILVISAILAYATTRFIEQPFRNWPLLDKSMLASIVFSALLIVPPALAIHVWQNALTARLTEAGDMVESANETALNIRDGAGGSWSDITLSPLAAGRDYALSYNMQCHASAVKPEPQECRFEFSGDPNGSIVVVGSSHDAHWTDAAVSVAEEYGYDVSVYIKGGCPFGDVSMSEWEFDPSCFAWNETLLQRFLSDPPAAVVTVASRYEGGQETVPAWRMHYIETLTDAGIPVVGVRDNPWFPMNIPACVEASPTDNCSGTVGEFNMPNPDIEVPVLPGFTFVDLSDALCPSGKCSPTKNGTLLYRDSNHLTRTGILMIDEPVREALRGAL